MARSRGWRVAGSLERLLSQINSQFPGRSKRSDGSIGNVEHSRRKNDHNSNAGIVRARDFTHDPKHGMDANRLAKSLYDSKDPRIKYVIWDGKIWNPSKSDSWRPYHGKNPHDKHLHISVNKDFGDNPRPWKVVPATGDELFQNRGRQRMQAPGKSYNDSVQSAVPPKPGKRSDYIAEGPRKFVQKPGFSESMQAAPPMAQFGPEKDLFGMMAGRAKDSGMPPPMPTRGDRSVGIKQATAQPRTGSEPTFQEDFVGSARPEDGVLPGPMAPATPVPGMPPVPDKGSRFGPPAQPPVPQRGYGGGTDRAPGMDLPLNGDAPPMPSQRSSMMDAPIQNQGSMFSREQLNQTFGGDFGDLYKAPSDKWSSGPVAINYGPSGNIPPPPPAPPLDRDNLWPMLRGGGGGFGGGGFFGGIFGGF